MLKAVCKDYKKNQDELKMLWSCEDQGETTFAELVPPYFGILENVQIKNKKLFDV